MPLNLSQVSDLLFEVFNYPSKRVPIWFSCPWNNGNKLGKLRALCQKEIVFGGNNGRRAAVEELFCAGRNLAQKTDKFELVGAITVNLHFFTGNLTWIARAILARIPVILFRFTRMAMTSKKYVGFLQTILIHARRFFDRVGFYKANICSR